MSSANQELSANSSRMTLKPVSGAPGRPHSPKLGVLTALRTHWPEYLMEAGLLGTFMVAACVFGALYEFPHSLVHRAIMSSLLRRILMGISMGLTAITLIYSPWGKQ